MTTYSNFDSWNGWILPGSGRQVVYDYEDCWMDENGDIWVPCFGCAADSQAHSAPMHIMEGNNPKGG